MAKKPLLTIGELRQLLRYEPETGKLFWRERGPEWFKNGYRTAQGEANNWNSRLAGKEAGCLCPNGYIYLRLPSGHSLLAHRVAYAMHFGSWPKICDHINGNSLDNRIENLRDGNQQDNMRNARMWSHNTSGRTGVCRNKRQRTWTAFIKVDGREIFLGNRSDFAEAVALREAAERKYGFTARHGR